ncbi:unnamed protein product [Protopolystoma xenopodis]|uniref:Uncharacterized protein n=1 Tax=Protopolystoma xenopodis TaxID=117903 RepID=A0A448WYC0_9PLAT|nr:unnamed protein product [Protopolystoma xenopodis]
MLVCESIRQAGHGHSFLVPVQVQFEDHSGHSWTPNCSPLVKLKFCLIRE